MTTYDEYGVPVGAYSDAESLTTQARRLARAFFLYRIRPFAERRWGALRRSEWSVRRVCSLANALVLVWWVVLYWGERAVFNGAVESCQWEKWESWESGANPHRLIFVADPQLIDPHTYPGRPWPLNPLAYKYTDLYLRRTYSRFQTVLYPDTIFFLGDLFDGGREWSTRTTTSPEKRYRKYGDDFWLKEYGRFGNIFFKHWGDAGMEPRRGQPGRKIISSLPGNHDLGFAKGVQVGVRNRFNAYFGDGNRIDVIANHTFVSIDALSLSALGQDSPEQVADLWRPTREFLDNAKSQKHRNIQRELRVQAGLRPYPGFPHYDIPAHDLATAALPHASDPVTDFPTILLTHIPLYRAPGTPCGPQREHWPPTPPRAGEPPLEYDDRNAIAVRGGYQYQNVLNREISAEIAEKVGDIRYAFSGDDHDYCEVLHRGYASAGGGIKEITVKSISWAMGVRHPGVVMASLWNPVDTQGKPLNNDASKTLQTHLCLLPDQIGTFLTYALLFGATLTLLLLRAALIALGLLSPSPQPHTDAPPLLPTTHPYTAEKQTDLDKETEKDHSAHSSTSSTHSANLQIRSAQARGRSISPITNTNTQNPTPYTYPLVQHAGYYPTPTSASTPDLESEQGDEARLKPKVKIYGSRKEHVRVSRPQRREKKKGWGLFFEEARGSLGWVVGCGLGAYGWLVWRG